MVADHLYQYVFLNTKGWLNFSYMQYSKSTPRQATKISTSPIPLLQLSSADYFRLIMPMNEQKEHLWIQLVNYSLQNKNNPGTFAILLLGTPCHNRWPPSIIIFLPPLSMVGSWFALFSMPLLSMNEGWTNQP